MYLVGPVPPTRQTVFQRLQDMLALDTFCQLDLIEGDDSLVLAPLSDFFQNGLRRHRGYCARVIVHGRLDWVFWFIRRPPVTA